MSSGDSNMAGGLPGTAVSLLLLASIIQGFQDVALFHHEKQEAVAGQNITLPCIVKNPAGLKIMSIVWSKRNNASTKLALHVHGHGDVLFWPNLTMRLEEKANELVGSYLYLPDVKKRDSAIYVCVITTFPLGPIKAETKLSIQDDIAIECNVHSNIVIHNGGNVTIDCTTSFPNAQLRWTKNKNAVSKNASLQLWRVTDANAGIYTLTVNTGNKTLHKEFIITVLPANTSWRTDLTTVSPHHQTEATVSSLATTTSITANNPNTSNATITSDELLASSTDSTFTTVTSSPASSSDIADLLSTATSRYNEKTEFRSTQEITRNQFELQTPHPEGILPTRREESISSRNISNLLENPDVTSNPSAGNMTGTTVDKVRVNKEKSGKRGHLLLALIIIPMLLLIAAAGFLYRRWHIKKSMDLPPPFKPPPPPVKYTAPRRCETSTQPHDMRLI